MPDQEDAAQVQAPAPNPGRRFTAHVPTPTRLKISEDGLAQRWKQFARSWSIYERASRLKEEKTGYRCSVLLACIGDEAMEVFDGFTFGEGESEDDIDVVLAKFEQSGNNIRGV